MLLFQESRSKTLKILNFILVLNIIFVSIMLIFSLTNMLFPSDYTYSDTYRHRTMPLTGLDMLDYKDTASDDILPSSDFENDANFVPVCATGVMLICPIVALIVCNKRKKLFDVTKPSGLKALTAVSVIAILALVYLVLQGIFSGAFDSGDSLIVLFVVLSGIGICVLAPFTANFLGIFNMNHNKWIEYINVVMVVILCGALISFINTLIFIQSYDCSLKSICDQNSLPRTTITEVAIILLVTLALYVVKKIYNTEASNKKIVDSLD